MNQTAVRWKCSGCRQIHLRTHWLHAPNPFEPRLIIWGCPSCKDIGTDELVCDVPTCQWPVSCGTPTPAGYRQTCYEHAPKLNK